MSVATLPIFPEETEFKINIKQKKTKPQNVKVLLEIYFLQVVPALTSSVTIGMPEKATWLPSLDHFPCSRCSEKRYKLYCI